MANGISPVNTGSRIAPRTPSLDIPRLGFDADMKAAEAEVNPLESINQGLEQASVRDARDVQTERIEQEIAARDIVMQQQEENRQFASKLSAAIKSGDADEQLSILMSNPALAAREANRTLSRGVIENLKAKGPQFENHVAPLEIMVDPDGYRERLQKEQEYQNKVRASELTGETARNKAYANYYNSLAKRTGSDKLNDKELAKSQSSFRKADANLLADSEFVNLSRRLNVEPKDLAEKAQIVEATPEQAAAFTRKERIPVSPGDPLLLYDGIYTPLGKGSDLAKKLEARRAAAIGRSQLASERAPETPVGEAAVGATERATSTAPTAPATAPTAPAATGEPRLATTQDLETSQEVLKEGIVAGKRPVQGTPLNKENRELLISGLTKDILNQETKRTQTPVTPVQERVAEQKAKDLVDAIYPRIEDVRATPQYPRRGSTISEPQAQSIVETKLKELIRNYMQKPGVTEYPDVDIQKQLRQEAEQFVRENYQVRVNSSVPMTRRSLSGMGVAQ